jgi:predicted  nucleic acid-binding Zn-ribbon protein
VTATTSPSHRWLWVLGAGVLVAGGYAGYLGTQTQDLRHRFDAAQQDNAALRAKLADTDTDLQNALNSLRDDLSQAQQDASTNVAKAESAAAKHADIVASRLAKKTAEEAQALNAELGKVKESAVDASNKIDGINTDVGAVKTDVGAVKTDVASTKSALDETRSELQRARGDMGVMSGLVATNSKQIQTLRDLGDRNIYEFTLSKDGKMQKVGDIELTLRKADAGRSRFTLDVLADDKRVEKKDRTINEPVQFYTSKAHQPYELVVNKVNKNQIVGYLATPKVTLARNEAAAQ